MQQSGKKVELHLNNSLNINCRLSLAIRVDPAIIRHLSEKDLGSKGVLSAACGATGGLP